MCSHVSSRQLESALRRQSPEAPPQTGRAKNCSILYVWASSAMLSSTVESCRRKWCERLHCGVDVVRWDFLIVIQKHSMHLNELEVMVQSHRTRDGISYKWARIIKYDLQQSALTSEALWPQRIYLFPWWKYYNSPYCKWRNMCSWISTPTVHGYSIMAIYKWEDVVIWCNSIRV